MSPLLQGNTGDYITPLISSNRDIEVQEVQEGVQGHTEEYLTPLISRTRDIEIYTQQPYSGQYSTVQCCAVQYSTVQQPYSGESVDIEMFESPHQDIGLDSSEDNHPGEECHLNLER